MAAALVAATAAPLLRPEPWSAVVTEWESSPSWPLTSHCSRQIEVLIGVITCKKEDKGDPTAREHGQGGVGQWGGRPLRRQRGAEGGEVGGVRTGAPPSGRKGCGGHPSLRQRANCAVGNGVWSLRALNPRPLRKLASIVTPP